MKKGLVVEGGAMRGIFAAGVLDGFLKHGKTDFDFAIGVSAGATNLSTYVSGSKGVSKTIITRYATTRDFFDPIRFIKGGHMTDVHWLWHHCKNALPIPVDDNRRSMQVFVGVTNTESGQCEYLPVTKDNIDSLMVATCALPLSYREQPEINGIRYVDGGVADPIPVIQAYEKGARDITVILSQPLGYTKKPAKATWLINKMYQHQPALLATMLKRDQIYNDTLAFIKNPPAGVKINIIAPDDTFCVKRLTMNKRKLMYGYRAGMRAAKGFCEQQAVPSRQRA